MSRLLRVLAWVERGGEGGYVDGGVAQQLQQGQGGSQNDEGVAQKLQWSREGTQGDERVVQGWGAEIGSPGTEVRPATNHHGRGDGTLAESCAGPGLTEELQVQHRCQRNDAHLMGGAMAPVLVQNS